MDNITVTKCPPAVAQGAYSTARQGKLVTGVKRPKRDPKPAQGSQDWAETSGDDLGESPDF